MSLINNKNKFLIVVVGPTAVGKTALSIQLAKYFQTEIISADARQFYKEMSIGTAKPDAEEMDSIPHYFINSHSIEDDYSVGQFEKDALKALEQIFERKNVAILVGGSGLYVKVVCEGMDKIPDIDPEIRESLQSLYDLEGLTPLLEKLQDLDPGHYEVIDKSNTQRVMRALEVCIGTGMPFSGFRNNTKAERPFNIITVGLTLPRDILYKRIDDRMDLMLEAGLLEEAKNLIAYRHKNALQTVGYKEIFDYLDGQYNWAEAVRLLKRNSRRYAKRQMTWFNKDTSITWLSPYQLNEIINLIEQQFKLAH